MGGTVPGKQGGNPEKDGGEGILGPARGNLTAHSTDILISIDEVYLQVESRL